MTGRSILLEEPFQAAHKSWLGICGWRWEIRRCRSDGYFCVGLYRCGCAGRWRSCRCVLDRRPRRGCRLRLGLESSGWRGIRHGRATLFTEVAFQVQRAFAEPTEHRSRLDEWPFNRLLQDLFIEFHHGSSQVGSRAFERNTFARRNHRRRGYSQGDGGVRRGRRAARRQLLSRLRRRC